MKKIIQKYEECIGCQACVAVCPEYWEMVDEDMKARPINGKLNEDTKNYELEIGEDDLGCHEEAVNVCPVQIIEIV